MTVSQIERLRDWTLAISLIGLGASGQAAEAEAIRTNRSLLTDPNPVMAVTAASADALRKAANSAHGVYGAAWQTGEARLTRLIHRHSRDSLAGVA